VSKLCFFKKFLSFFSGGSGGQRGGGASGAGVVEDISSGLQDM